ncbi:MAG: PEP-CTERM sorting domain-containing protein [Bryobacteraceae bacterium]
MKRKILGIPVAVCGLAFLGMVTNASAGVIGHLDITNCGGGDVRVSATAIDFTLPVGGGTGCIITGGTTNVSYAGGTLGANVTGTILDLILTPGNPPVPGFMTFNGTPLNFTLLSLGPGVSNAACSAVLDPNMPSCSVGGTTPFILTPTSTGTSVTLSVFGTVSDGTLPISNFLGAFTTQISSTTPLSIANTILAGGTVVSTNSGAFDITLTGVPEPGTLSMAALGGLLVLFAARKRAKA